MTTLHAVVSIADTPAVEVRDAAGRVLARRATWALAEQWAERYEAERREPTDRAWGLEEIGAEIERLSRGGQR